MTKHIFGQRPGNRRKTVDITTLNKTETENIQRYTEKMNDYTESTRKTPENRPKSAIEYIRYGERNIQKFIASKSDENGKSNRQIRNKQSGKVRKLTERWKSTTLELSFGAGRNPEGRSGGAGK